jgi:mannose-6-phosphate isomerase-like protein (cupin superfamily)
MIDRQRLWWVPAVLLLVLCAASPAGADEAQYTGQNIADMKFVVFPGMPACATGAVPSGDPAKGPSFILAQMGTGCSFPWHWHTPNEHLMMVSGAARVEMKDGGSTNLQPGGFALMPSKHVHRFTCTKACKLYVYSDAIFDIHYVDKAGKEIPPEEALKTAAKAPAKKMK